MHVFPSSIQYNTALSRRSWITRERVRHIGFIHCIHIWHWYHILWKEKRRVYTASLAGVVLATENNYKFTRQSHRCACNTTFPCFVISGHYIPAPSTIQDHVILVHHAELSYDHFSRLYNCAVFVRKPFYNVTHFLIYCSTNHSAYDMMYIMDLGSRPFFSWY